MQRVQAGNKHHNAASERCGSLVIIRMEVSRSIVHQPKTMWQPPLYNIEVGSSASPGLGLVKLARRGALLNKEGFREVGGEGDIVSVLFLSLSLSALQLFLFYANRV